MWNHTDHILLESPVSDILRELDAYVCRGAPPLDTYSSKTLLDYVIEAPAEYWDGVNFEYARRLAVVMYFAYRSMGLRVSAGNLVEAGLSRQPFSAVCTFLAFYSPDFVRVATSMESHDLEVVLSWLDEEDLYTPISGAGSMAYEFTLLHAHTVYLRHHVGYSDDPLLDLLSNEFYNLKLRERRRRLELSDSRATEIVMCRG